MKSHQTVYRGGIGALALALSISTGIVPAVSAQTATTTPAAAPAAPAAPATPTWETTAADGKPFVQEISLKDALAGHIAADNTLKDIPVEKSWLNAAWRYRNRTDDTAKNVKYFEVYSPSMGRRIPINVITPTGSFDVSRPTIYLLSGAGGAEQGMDWITMTADYSKLENVVEFYRTKNVNVVIPQAGAFSYYTDWLETPEGKYYPGPVRWETFLTKELPGPLEGLINGNGKRAVAGMSMAATSSLLLAEHHPGFYHAVASYSGCAATTTWFPRAWVGLTLDRGTANPEQMWGPADSQYAAYNDALINANNLKGTKDVHPEIYISTNSGFPGKDDMISSIMERHGGSSFNTFTQAFATSSSLIIEGGAIEGAMNSCTHDLESRLKEEGIKADYVFRPTGTHSWPGWRKDISESWPTYARAFGQNGDPNFEDPAAVNKAS